MVIWIAATLSGLAVVTLTTVVALGAADPPDGKAQDVKPHAKPLEAEGKGADGPKAPESKSDAQTQNKGGDGTKAQESKPDPKAPGKGADGTKAQESKPDSKPEGKGAEGTRAQESKPDSKAAGKGADGTKAQEPKSDSKAAEGKAPAKPEPKTPDSPPNAPGAPIVSIKLALMADPRLFPYDVNVDMHGETAELSGKVGSDAEKAAATEVAQSIDGIKSVANNLEVVKDLPQSMAKRRDELITQYVKERFTRSKTLETAHFDVKTEDGIVSLTGKTRFLVIALEAAEAARQVPGVKAVRTDGIRIEAPE